MTRLEQLQKEYTDNLAALKDITAKRSADGTFPADVQDQIRKANEDCARIMSEMETERILEKRLKEEVLLEFHNRPEQTSTTAGKREINYESVFWRHLQRQNSSAPSELTPEERSILEKRGTSTQITTSDSLGGYLVPTQFSQRLENMMKWYANMMTACQVWDDRAAGGGTLEWPTGDDTAVSGNINTAANQAAQRTVSDLTFGQVLFNDWLIDSNIIKVSRSLMQDERVGLLQNVLSENLANRIGRKANSVWTNGTGTNQPYGLTTTVTNSAGTTASGTAITKAELVKFQASIDYSYQNNPKTGWMMHQSVLAYLRTLDFSTDTTHIFVPGNLATGEPDRLLGWPVFINNDLPAVTGATGLPVTATKHIYLGDFSKFVIRQIRDVSIERNDYLYWDALSVGFMGWMRTDSNLINANAIKSILQA